jgi:hypothetical protein
MPVVKRARMGSPAPAAAPMAAVTQIAAARDDENDNVAYIANRMR